MRPPSVRRPTVPRRGHAALLALGAVGALACADAPLGGPGLPGRGVSLRLEPRVAPRASVAAAGIAQVRVAIVRVPDGLVVLDSVVDLAGPAGAELDLDVPLAAATDRFAVRLAAADAAGDTIFRAADTTEVARGSVAPILELLLRYAGPDTAIARIVAGPDTAVLDPGGSAPLWAVGYRAGADEATPLAHVAWRSADAGVVSVSPTGGHVTAIAPGGAAWIYATTATGLVDSARVVVRHLVATLEATPAAVALAPGGTQRVAVAGRAADGTALAAPAVTWTSSDSAVAVVDAAGDVVAVGAGSATLVATSGGARVAVPVTVAAAPVAALHVAPAAVSLVRLQRAQLVATATLADGAVAHDRTPTWTTSDPAVATVGADGVVSAVGVGAATVTATVAGRSASVAVAVAPLPASEVVASPRAVQLAPGASLLLAATATDADGHPLPNTPIAWTSADPSVAVVSAAGIVTAVAPGETTLSASANGRAGTVAVTVRPLPAATVVLSHAGKPGPVERLELVAGATADLDATALAPDGAALPGRAAAWWTTAPAVATVDADGRVTAVAPGRAYVGAAIEKASAWVQVDVGAVAVAQVRLSAAALVISAGATHQLRADAYDGAGRLLPGRGASWTSSDPNVAEVAADGLVTARRAGLATVAATVEGRTATATVAVLPAVGAAVRFTTPTARYALGQTMSAQGVGLSADLGAATLQLASWNGAVAGVQPSVAVTGTRAVPFAVTGRALGATTLQGTAVGAAQGTTAIEVVPATLRAEGWSGATLREGRLRRIILRAGGADGAATDAVFAEATEFTFDFDDDRIAVHVDKDASPTRAAGAVGSNAHGSSIRRNSTVVRAPVGEAFLSVIVKGKEEGTARLRVKAANGRYVTLDLRDLRIEEEDDD